MKVSMYTNAKGRLCTDDFDSDEDEYDAGREEAREMSEQAALDDYMTGYLEAEREDELREQDEIFEALNEDDEDDWEDDEDDWEDDRGYYSGAWDFLEEDF